MYLHPPNCGYKDGMIPSSWLNKFRRRTDRDKERDNILRQSKYISGHELHTAPKWQCFWLYDEQLHIPPEVLNQYASLYGTNVDYISTNRRRSETSTCSSPYIEQEIVRLMMSHSP
jgi:hypothetical protein